MSQVPKVRAWCPCGEMTRDPGASQGTPFWGPPPWLWYSRLTVHCSGFVGFGQNWYGVRRSWPLSDGYPIQRSSSMRFEKVMETNPPSPPGYVVTRDSMGGYGQLYPMGAAPFPPLDLPYLAGYLTDKGIQVEVVEALGLGL